MKSITCTIAVCVALLGVAAADDPVTTFFNDLNAWCSASSGHEAACVAPPAGVGIVGAAFAIKYIIQRCRAAPHVAVNAQVLFDIDNLPEVMLDYYGDHWGQAWFEMADGWKCLVGISTQPTGEQSWRQALQQGDILAYQDEHGNMYDQHRQPIPDAAPAADPNANPADQLPDMPSDGGAGGNLPDHGQPIDPSHGLPSGGGSNPSGGGDAGGDIPDPDHPVDPIEPLGALQKGARRCGKGCHGKGK